MDIQEKNHSKTMIKYAFRWNQSIYNAGNTIVEAISEEEAIFEFKRNHSNVDMRVVKWEKL